MSGPAGTPDDSPLTLADVQASPEYRDLETPKLGPGDRAIDFRLPMLDQPASSVRLSDFAGDKAVALVFGSFT